MAVSASDSAAIGSPLRRFVDVAVALLIGVVLQFAAVAKVSTGVRHLEQLNASRIAASHGLPAKVTDDDFQWLISPGSMPGTPFEKGVLLDIAVGTAEFGLVLFVLAFCRTRVVWMLVPILFGTFFGYALQKLLTDQPCGCFGALWEPPKGFSLVMDGLFVVLGIALAAWHRVRGGALVAVIVLTVLGAGGGYLYATQSSHPPAAKTAASGPVAPVQEQPVAEDPSATTTPTPADPAPAQPLVRSDVPPGERLLASPMLEDLRALGEDDPAWYVFIWDPTCPTCDAMLPVVQHYAGIYAEEGNPVLQVRDLMKQDIEKQAGIADWEWTGSPTILIVRNGAIIQVYEGEGSPFPDAVSDRLFADEPIDDLQPD